MVYRSLKTDKSICLALAMNSDTGLGSVEKKEESSPIHHKALIEMLSAIQQIIRSHKYYTANHTRWLLKQPVVMLLTHTQTNSAKPIISSIRSAAMDK